MRIAERRGMTQFTGACLCGGVQLVASGEPEGVVACHCASCRRHSGAPCAVFADYRIDRVAITGTSFTRFASSPGVWRGFCGTCGSTVSYQGTNLPDMIHLHIGIFDDPGRFRPQANEHEEMRLPWIHVSIAD
jgi:hypothetical protein